MVLNSEEEEEEQSWTGDGYEDNLTATYGAVAAAPNVGSMEKNVPSISPPTPNLQSNQALLCLLKDFLKVGLWNSGTTMVSNGSTITAEIQLRWVEDGLPVG